MDSRGGLLADNPRARTVAAGARGHKVSTMIRKRPRADDRGKSADYFESSWTTGLLAARKSADESGKCRVADFRGRFDFDWKVAECPWHGSAWTPQLGLKGLG